MSNAIQVSTPPVRIYEASPIKRRRATKSEVTERRLALFNIVANMQPMTVRQVFYQASVKNIVEKTEAGYAKVQTDLVLMRRAGVLPYDWLADSTRWQRKPDTFNSVQEALKETARFYRKALWADAEVYVEVWLEKDALAGVVYPITSMYDVPLMVARGFSSDTFLHSTAKYIQSLDVPTYIYHLGDFDPSGVAAAEKIRDGLKKMAPHSDIKFERLAVKRWQIEEWKLPTRPTKKSDSRSKNFGDISADLDAIEPSRLRGLVADAIERHLPRQQLAILKEAEESERGIIRQLVGDALNGGRQ
jgi:hypothetical protein